MREKTAADAAAHAADKLQREATEAAEDKRRETAHLTAERHLKELQKIVEIEKSPVFVKAWTAEIRKSPDMSSQVLKTVKLGDPLFAQASESNQFRFVRWGDRNRRYSEGWVRASVLTPSIEEGDIRRITYVHTHTLSARARQDILKGSVRIGMSKEHVKASWGEPSDINTTVTRYSRHEQWVYGIGSYVYFENGVVTAIQN
ncbi:MAG TPA: hypothetical protein VGK99_21390 [Acidobacteriota bacterium]